MAVFNNSLGKPFIIADTNALSLRGGFCPFRRLAALPECDRETDTDRRRTELQCQQSAA